MKDTNTPLDKEVLQSLAGTLSTDCRWGRHPNSHSAREHFHQPPNAGAPIDTDFSGDYRDVLSMILVVIQDRIEKCWQE